MIKKLNFLMLLLLVALPRTILAYSDYIVAGGDNIGIQIKMDTVLVIGTYDIEGIDPATKAGLKVGDRIEKINDKQVSSVADITNLLTNNRSNTIEIGYVRNGKSKKTELTLINGQSGLYLKDTISGIGTLTFIDPETKKFGALGHEIVDSTNGELVDVQSGKIFSSTIHSITKSRDGIPGEKNATFHSGNSLGEIKENTNKGIFGVYDSNFSTQKLYKVASTEDIKLGDAYIRTVVDGNQIQEYKIRIMKVSETKDNTKNIVFQIIDTDLLEETGGIIQGMSGSPIIQGDYIVGAVTHVVVNDPEKGYGILITNMLEEAENGE